MSTGRERRCVTRVIGPTESASSAMRSEPEAVTAVGLNRTTGFGEWVFGFVWWRFPVLGSDHAIFTTDSLTSSEPGTWHPETFN
jgi:hypothetical protein